jgi:hypothetical protein
MLHIISFGCGGWIIIQFQNLILIFSEKSTMKTLLILLSALVCANGVSIATLGGGHDDCKVR